MNMWSRQEVRALRHKFFASERAKQREEARVAKRKARGIAGGSRSRQFSPIDMTIKAVRDAVEGAMTMKLGVRSRTGFIKCARRLYNGDKIDRSWRSYPREAAIQIDGRIVL